MEKSFLQGWKKGLGGWENTKNDKVKNAKLIFRFFGYVFWYFWKFNFVTMTYVLHREKFLEKSFLQGWKKRLGGWENSKKTIRLKTQNWYLDSFVTYFDIFENLILLLWRRYFIGKDFLRNHFCKAKRREWVGGWENSKKRQR